jgi:hypothetical protein
VENKIKPIPNMISVIGQGSGRPRGLGLFRIINVESAIRRNPDTMKHIFAIFNIITSSFYYFSISSQKPLNRQAFEIVISTLNGEDQALRRQYQ